MPLPNFLQRLRPFNKSSLFGDPASADLTMFSYIGTPLQRLRSPHAGLLQL